MGSNAAAKRSASRGQGRRQQPQAETWTSSIGTLLNSQLGREILADALDAASAVLRRDRSGQQVTSAVNAVADAGGNVASTAVDVSTDVASSALDAGAKMASAVSDIAETAVGSLAAIATGAVLDMQPGGQSDEDEPKRSGRGRRGRRGAEDEEGATS
jgi:hypothetical protein